MNRRDQLEDKGVHRRMTLKYVLEGIGVVSGNGFVWLRIVKWLGRFMIVTKGVL